MRRDLGGGGPRPRRRDEPPSRGRVGAASHPARLCGREEPAACLRAAGGRGGGPRRAPHVRRARGRPARRAVPRAALRRAGRQGEGEGALAAPRPGGQGRAQGRHGHHLRKAVGQDWRPAADGGEPRDARGGRRVGPRHARPAARARLPPGAQADHLLVRAGRLGGPRRDDRRGASPRPRGVWNVARGSPSRRPGAAGAPAGSRAQDARGDGGDGEDHRPSAAHHRQPGADGSDREPAAARRPLAGVRAAPRPPAPGQPALGERQHGARRVRVPALALAVGRPRRRAATQRAVRRRRPLLAHRAAARRHRRPARGPGCGPRLRVALPVRLPRQQHVLLHPPPAARARRGRPRHAQDARHGRPKHTRAARRRRPRHEGLEGRRDRLRGGGAPRRAAASAASGAARRAAQRQAASQAAARGRRLGRGQGPGRRA
mmetsp:Transcript_45013/g.149176  ORF Transcript_45013/g.149176 Transcript_45013/m.149176 type:complete len:432 (-) Transcript_45013:1247-2542(-)